MENKHNEEKFDSYINKIIIFSSKGYFKKQVNISNIEKTILDDEYYSNSLGNYILDINTTSSTNKVENNLELHNALKSLSTIEQAVILLLFTEDVSQEEASKILEICSKSVSRIKIRAINKLKKYLMEDNNDEK